MPTFSARPVKHSLTLRGHRTSVSLETAFWDEFRRIASEAGRSVNDLAAEIDAARDDAGLASAIRVHVLTALRRERG
ncbi:aryl-sulfate sulfotransferase [bacterium]|nr:aryl-sulfate sulfotransferase [bacterium]